MTAIEAADGNAKNNDGSVTMTEFNQILIDEEAASEAAFDRLSQAQARTRPRAAASRAARLAPRQRRRGRRDRGRGRARACSARPRLARAQSGQLLGDGALVGKPAQGQYLAGPRR